MLGVNAGIFLVLTVSALGVGHLFQLHPMLPKVMRWVCFVYLIYLAFSIARSFTGALAESKQSRKVTFQTAFLLQWLNPKVWMMSLTALSIFPKHGPEYLESAALVVLVITIINLPSISLWAGFGSLMSRHLSTPQRSRLFGYLMAGLLLATAVLVILD